MNQSNPVLVTKPRIGVDPWGKSMLEAGVGPLPKKAEFLCTLEIQTIVDSDEVHLFVNWTGRLELEIWQKDFCAPCKLLSRTLPDPSQTASQQYEDALFDICRSWLGFQDAHELVKPGLIDKHQWSQVKHRLEIEWSKIGSAKTAAIQAQLAGGAKKRRPAKK